MWVCVGQTTQMCPCIGVHQRMSIMSLYLLLQQRLAYLVRLIWMVYEMGSKWPYSCCFVFKTARSILVGFLYSFFFNRFVDVYVVQPYRNTNTCTAWNNSRFILSERSDFYMINSLPIAVYAFPMCILTLLSIDDILLPLYMNWSIHLRCLSWYELNNATKSYGFYVGKIRVENPEWSFSQKETIKDCPTEDWCGFECYKSRVGLVIFPRT